MQCVEWDVKLVPAHLFLSLQSTSCSLSSWTLSQSLSRLSSLTGTLRRHALIACQLGFAMSFSTIYRACCWWHDHIILRGGPRRPNCGLNIDRTRPSAGLRRPILVATVHHSVQTWVPFDVVCSRCHLGLLRYICRSTLPPADLEWGQVATLSCLATVFQCCQSTLKMFSHATTALWWKVGLPRPSLLLRLLRSLLHI